MKNIEDLIDTFENTGDNGNFFIGDYSNVEIATYIRQQQEEIDRLTETNIVLEDSTNYWFYIVNEIEKHCKQIIELHNKYDAENNCEWILYPAYYEILSKIKELKGSDKE